MANFWDFLSTFIKSRRDKEKTSVVVKVDNGINGRNGSVNYGSGKRTPSPKKAGGSRQESQHSISESQVLIQSIQLYSTGKRGKTYTKKFYKSINHNFGIEVVLKNLSGQAKTVHLGHCIYDEKGVAIFKGDFRPTVKPFSTLKQDIYVDPKAFEKMKSGTYKSQFWLNDKRVQKVFFTVAYK